MIGSAHRAAFGIAALLFFAGVFVLAPSSLAAAAGENQDCSDSCEGPPCPCRAQQFDDEEWKIEKLPGTIPEAPFRVRVDDVAIGRTRILTFANRLGRSNRLPQVLVISSSGYLRLKPGADPSPPLPFGQSLVLGPAIFGSSSSFPGSTLFFNPQVQEVSVDTSRLHRNGKGALVIEVVARDRRLPPTDPHTNQVMDLKWKMVLPEPSQAKTWLTVTGSYRFTEEVVPDPVRTSQLQSFRLVQVSSMFIDGDRHDADGFRYPSAGGLVSVGYVPGQAGTLLPPAPSPLSVGAPILDSIHGDDVGLPNGDTPSYRIRIDEASGPLTGPLLPRAYFNSSQDLNDDNLGLWVYRRPAAAIPADTRGRIRLKLTATADPLPPP